MKDNFYIWNEMFSNDNPIKEEILADKYILSVQTNEEPEIINKKYWDYFNHIGTLKNFNENIRILVSKTHEEERDR